MKRLFVVDDDTDILLSLEIWFARKGFAVEIFSTPESLLTSLQSTVPDVMLIDIHLQNKDGRKICQELKQDHKALYPIILYSNDGHLLKDYKTYLADDAIEKPFSLKELTEVILFHLHTPKGYI